MARELRWWVGAPLAACGIVVLAYIPPRGVPHEPRHRAWDREPSAARVRAQDLAAQWRAADLALRVAEYRRRLEPELARRRSADQAGLALLVDGPDSSAKAVQPILRAALDTVWARLGLGVTKVSAALAVDWRPLMKSVDTPKPDRGAFAYLLPDSTDRATCIAVIPAWGRLVLEPKLSARLEGWLKQGLGPCAFYAAFGVPGRAVRHWLARRSYDVALHPDWDREGPASAASWLRDSATQRWRWGELYFGFPSRFSSTTLACLGGRADRCREAVLEGAGYVFDDSLPRFVTVTPWWRRKLRLLDGDRYLADVARAVGHDRFLRFWNSTEPVDTALAAALKMPVGEWTERWERRFVPRLPLGAAAPLGASGLGVLLAGAALASVALGAKRRQVR